MKKRPRINWLNKKRQEKLKTYKEKKKDTVTECADEGTRNKH